MKLFAILLTSFLFSNAFAVSNLQTCFSPAENCDQVLMDYMKGAQKSLDIAIYSLSLRGVREVLLDAKSRGVKIRMVVDREQAGEKVSLIPTLIQDGFDIRYGSQEGLMHNKFTIVDGKWLEFGSYNYTYRATKYNAENQFYTNEASVVSRYQKNFDSIYATGLTQ